jgi:hypothetical protein
MSRFLRLFERRRFIPELRTSSRLTFLQVSFPAVPAAKFPVKKVVNLLAGNFEVNETEALSRVNGALTLFADDGCPEFHKSPSQLCFLFLVRELVS